MSPHTRLFGWGAGLLALVLVSIWCWRLSSDLQDPGDGDLLLPRATGVQPEDNLYVGLIGALAALDVLEGEPAEELRPDAWTTERIESVETASVVAKIDTALSREILQFPVPGEEDAPTLRFSVLADLLDLRSRLRAEQGRVDDAFEDALRIVAMGERLATGDGVTLIPAMVGARIQELGFARVRTLVEVPETDARTITQWLARLGDRPIPREARARVWAGEYEAFKSQFLEGMKQGRGEVPVYMRSVHEGYFFQENRTFAKISSGFRRLQNPQDACGADLSRTGEEMRAIDYVRPNAVGEILARVAAPDFVPYLEQFCALEVRRQGTRSVMALRAYREETGRDAEGLEALVPRYLESLPIDPFDGAALRYSREARRVWSVGRDRFDAGGETSGENTLDEIVIPTDLIVDVAQMEERPQTAASGG